MPGRGSDVIWRQDHLLGFVGAERAALPGSGVRHRLPPLQRRLAHLLSLSCNGLALGRYASGTHGYDTVDHFRIDPRLGPGSSPRAGWTR